MRGTREEEEQLDRRGSVEERRAGREHGEEEEEGEEGEI